MALGDIVVSIRGDERSFAAAAARARQENRRFRTAVTRNNARAASSFQQVEKAAFRLRARMIGLRAVAGGVASIFAGRGIVQYADQWRLAEARIATVTGDLGLAKQEMAELVQLANRSRGSIETLANAYAKLRLSRDELNKDTTFDLIETLQKSLIIGGNTSQEVRSVVLQLTQGIAADQLGGEELRTIRESGFFFQKILADGLGVTVGDLKQLGADSKLTAKAITEAITKMSDKVDEEFNKIPVTVGQASLRLQNNFREWVGSMDSASGATGALANSIVKFADNLGPILQGGLFAAAAGGALVFSRNVGRLTQTLGTNAAAAIRNQAAIRQSAKASIFAARVKAASAKADVEQARAAFLSAQANLRAATTQKAQTQASRELTAASQGLFRAQTRAATATNALATASARASISMRAAALAGSALRGALAFVGGPVGAAILAIAAGFALWSRNARKAAEATRTLANASEELAGISAKVTDENFVTTLARQQADIQRVTETIDTLKDSSVEAQRELRELSKVRDGSTRVARTSITGLTTEKVPGREFNTKEAERFAQLQNTIRANNENLISAENRLAEIQAARVVTEEEFIRLQRERSKESLNFDTGGGLTDKQTDKLANSLQSLRDRAAELKAEYDALGGSKGAAKSAALAQKTINDLANEGIQITPNLKEKIEALAKSIGQYEDKIGAFRKFNEEITSLEGKVSEARVEFENLGKAKPISEGAILAQQTINKLMADGVRLTPGMTAEVTRLANEYAGLQGRIDDASDAQDAFNDRMDEAKRLAEQYRTPLEVYRDRIKEINEAQKEFPDVFSNAAAERARAEAVGQYAGAIRAARDEQIKFSESIAEGIVFADSLGDAVRNVGTIIQRELAERLIVEPLTGFIDKGVSALGGLPGQAANDNSGKTVDQFGNIVEKAGQQVQGGFVPGIAQSISGLFTKQAAETAAAAATTSEATAKTAAAATTTASATTTAASLTALTASATAASGALATLGTSTSASAFIGGGSFGGFFAEGGTLSQGKFGIVGEEGPELISAASGPLNITPLNKLPSLSPGSGIASGGDRNNIFHFHGVKDMKSYEKNRATLEADMALAQRRASGDL